MPPSNKRALMGPAVAVLLAGVACGDDPTIATIPVRVELTPLRDTVYVGEIATRLTARVFNARDEEITGAPVTWRSDQPFIAAVDSLTGAVTGVLPGVAAVTARAGAVADTAEVFVLNALRVFLPLDTVILVPGDTFTLDVEVAVPPGTTPPPVTFGGGAPGIATVDPASGLVTALGVGVAPFVAVVDTVAVGGGIEVGEVADTIFGLSYIGLSGAVQFRGTLSSRAFNHPTNDGRTFFQIPGITPDAVHELHVLLIDSLTGPGTRTVGTMPPSGIGSGTDPVCRPTESFLFYRRSALSGSVVALSVAGGTVTVRSDRPILGGRAISGRLDVELQRTDVDGTAGRMRARGTFLVPLVSLASCPT